MADPSQAATFAAMFAGHHVGDHIAQTDAQAAAKTRPGFAGWSAMVGHILTYHAMVLDENFARGVGARCLR